MRQAIDSDDWTRAEDLYKDFLENKPDDESFVTFVKAQYQYRRAMEKSDSVAHHNLLELRTKSPDSFFPPMYLGRLTQSYKDYEKAAEYFIEASKLAIPSFWKTEALLRAADCQRMAKHGEKARDLLLSSLRSSDIQADDRHKAFRELQTIFGDLGQPYEAASLGELVLHEDPADFDIRFRLGLHYDQQKLYDLFLHHYQLLADHPPESAPVFHNLALAYERNKLPILAATNYKRAIGLGGTLAASNLSHNYLDAGMYDEAIALLETALAKPDCDPSVRSAIATANEKLQNEKTIEEQKASSTDDVRHFLVEYGRGLISGPVVIEGMWAFPDGEITLTLKGNEITGIATFPRKPQSEALGTSILIPTTKTVSFVCNLIGLSGILLKMETNPSPMSALISGLSALWDQPTKTRGFVRFASDGESGMVAELSGERLHKFYEIKRVS